MRPQQKNFIVEIKSKGRRSAVRQGSIWGTTDLKALTRQAAGIAPQLFDDGQKPNASVGAGQTGFENVVPPADINSEMTPGIIEGIAPIEETTLRQQPILGAVATDPVMETNETATAFRSPRRPRKAPKARADKADGLAAWMAPVTTAGSNDELEMLERENRILKGEFAARLQQENSWLRLMLERF